MKSPEESDYGVVVTLNYEEFSALRREAEAQNCTLSTIVKLAVDGYLTIRLIHDKLTPKPEKQ